MKKYDLDHLEILELLTSCPLHGRIYNPSDKLIAIFKKIEFEPRHDDYIEWFLQDLKPESDSSYYVTHCCNREFIGKENRPFEITLNTDNDIASCLLCGKDKAFDKGKICGPDKKINLFRYKRSNE